MRKDGGGRWEEGGWRMEEGGRMDEGGGEGERSKGRSDLQSNVEEAREEENTHGFSGGPMLIKTKAKSSNDRTMLA
jgi:hypothetical protein